MPALRFRQRHVHQSLIDYLRGQLADLGWVNDPVNFATTPVTFMEVTPDDAGTPVASNTVCITFGDEPENVEEELGGALISVGFPLYVDVYGLNQAMALSIACDVKTCLYRKVAPVYDYSAAPPTLVEGSYVEFEEVDGPLRPAPSLAAGADNFRRFWRVVQATATTYFQT